MKGSNIFFESLIERIVAARESYQRIHPCLIIFFILEGILGRVVNETLDRALHTGPRILNSVS